MINEFKTQLITQVQSIISENYSQYEQLLLRKLNNFIQTIKNTKKVTLILNKRDFEKFSRNTDVIEQIFQGDVKLVSSKDEFIGGFKILSEDENISYEFSIDNEILKQSTFIENKFSMQFSEKEIQGIINDFELFIKNKREDIEEYLREYDKIE